MKTKIILALAGLALVSALPLQAQTNVIYFDPFTASGEPALNGSTPKDHGGTGTEAWTAPDDGMTMDGATLTITSGARWAALPFIPADGNKYRVSMDMNATHTGSDWFAVGFAETPDPMADYPSQRLSGWLLIRGFDPGYPLHSFTGYGTDGGGQAGDFTGPHNISVVLDTSVANWTFEFFVDGVSQRGPVAFSSTPDVNPSIQYATFGSYGSARGTMDNFKLENIFHVETGPPTIANQPKDATVLIGGTAKFEVLAAGPKPITYQWYKNNQMLTGETASQLTVSKLTVADSGSAFNAKVANSYGATTTSNATLTVLNVTGPLIHKFNFNDGTANDSVGGMKGVLKGTATITDGQLLLDGSEAGFVLLSDYAMPPTGSATVVAWFRTSSTVGKSARVFDFGSGTLNYLYFTPMTATNGAAQFGIKTGDDPETAITYTPTLNDDLDHMVAAVIDSTPTATGANGTVYLYIDGTSAGTSDLNGTITLASLDSGPQNYIGKSQWVNTGDLPYKGSIDEVRVYNAALSESALSALVPDPNKAGDEVTLQVESGAAGSIVLSWPQTATGFTLKSTPALVGASANWQTVNTAPVLNQGLYQVTVSTSTGTQFFRLQK